MTNNKTNVDNKSKNNTQTKEKIKTFLTPSFNVRDRYKEAKKHQNKKPINKWLKITTILLIIFSGITLWMTTYTNNSTQKLEEVRNTQLDMYEVTKFAILEDIRSWLTIQTKEDFINSKASMNALDWYKEEIFGTEFNLNNFYGATEVKAIDIQYTLEDEEQITKYYLMLNVTKGDTTKQLDLLVFVHGNKIFKILAL